MRKVLIAGLVVATVAGGAVVAGGGGVGAVATYGPTLVRAPYVTDLTQTTAEVNWATTTGTAVGSVQWVDAATTACSSVAWGTWSATRSTAVASTQVPYGPGSGTTGWSYTVGTTKEYQNSAELTGLVAGHTYCYAVYSAKASGTDLVLVGPTYQKVTTLRPSTSSSVSFDVVGDTGENFAATANASATAFPNSPTVNPYESALYGEIG